MCDFVLLLWSMRPARDGLPFVTVGKTTYLVSPGGMFDWILSEADSDQGSSPTSEMAEQRGRSTRASREAGSANPRPSSSLLRARSHSPLEDRNPRRSFQLPRASRLSERPSNPPVRASLSSRALDLSPPKPVDWKPELSEVWVQFPGHLGPVWGWHRIGAGDLPDAFFSSDGDMRVISESVLLRYAWADPITVRPEDHPHAYRLHPLLHAAARDALMSYHYTHDSAREYYSPIRTKADWQATISQGGDLALTYLLTCTQCDTFRPVRRTNSLIVENLPSGYKFLCAHVGAACYVASPHPFDFLVNPLERHAASPARTSYPTISELPPVGPGLSRMKAEPSRASYPTLTELPRLTPDLPRIHTLVPDEDEDQKWRKRLKLCTSVPKYRGTNSLVRLRAWKEAMQEAFRACKTPPGRTQVLGGAMFFADQAEEWWSARAGLSAGEEMQSFDDLCKALEKHFIPLDTVGKAVLRWNTLKQKGTVEEYMKEVDELAIMHPLGTIGEFWQTWNGLRPELKAEVRFALKREKKEVMTRAELRDLLEDVEVKYVPMPRPRQFVPFAPNRRFESKSIVAQTSFTPSSAPSVVTCWICDKVGHRASECSRRKASGCPRCGSKAHKLLACPQRKPAPRQTPARAAQTDSRRPRDREAPK